MLRLRANGAAAAAHQSIPGAVEALLTENGTQPRPERLWITRIHDLLRRDGFGGSYDAVRRYAALAQGAADGAAAFIPLMLPHLRCIAFGSGREKPAS